MKASSFEILPLFPEETLCQRLFAQAFRQKPAKLSPACSARSKYSPTVLLETLQIRAIVPYLVPPSGSICVIPEAPPSERSAQPNDRPEPASKHHRMRAWMQFCHSHSAGFAVLNRPLLQLCLLPFRTATRHPVN